MNNPLADQLSDEVNDQIAKKAANMAKGVKWGAAGFAAFGAIVLAAGVVDWNRNRNLDREADRMVKEQSKKEEARQKRLAEKYKNFGYGYDPYGVPTDGQRVLDAYDNRTGHTNMGNARFTQNDTWSIR